MKLTISSPDGKTQMVIPDSLIDSYILVRDLWCNGAILLISFIAIVAYFILDAYEVFGGFDYLAFGIYIMFVVFFTIHTIKAINGLRVLKAIKQQVKEKE